jgi:uncharacterized repeat protein (TIGR03803 family)
MRSRKLSLEVIATAFIAVALFFTSTRSMAQQERVLYSFGNSTDAADPTGDLIFDAAGNVYGTSVYGGAYGGGAVFELTPRASGLWTEKVLHSFGNGTDGANPRSGVIFDAAGHNLYGTTISGGTSGMGTVFELMPTAGGWSEKVLYSFDGTDGDAGWDRLIFDDAGNLYSTTTVGGAYGQGTVFELRPNASGGWNEKVLRNFGSGTDGAQPQGGLIFDSVGNLYGATTYGGTEGEGAVFEMSPLASGGWTETLLHSFAGGADGANPFAGVIFDAAGNLYGPTYWGGASSGYGTVYELVPTTGGGWTEETLFSFPNNYGADGSNPWPGVTLDSAGNIYGTTPYGGGADPGSGTAFELRLTAGGSWACELLHTFGNSATDGATPTFTRLIFDAAGNIYGLTGNGGAYGAGTLFEIKP